MNRTQTKLARLGAQITLSTALIACGGSTAEPGPTDEGAMGNEPQSVVTTKVMDVQAGEVSLGVRVVASDAPQSTVLIMHGGPAFSHDYLSAFDALATAERQVVYYDQRGAGMSSAPVSGSYALSAFAEDIEAVRVAVGAEQLDVVAHSWGGAVLWAYLAAHPARVRSVAFVGALSPNTVDAVEAQERIGERIGELQEQGLIPADLPADEGDDCSPSALAMTPAYFHDPTMATPFQLEATACSRGAMDAIIGANFPLPDAHAQAAAVFSGPVAVFIGESDPLGVELGDAVVRSLKSTSAELFIVPQAGHYPWLERDDFVETVDWFFGER